VEDPELAFGAETDGVLQKLLLPTVWKVTKWGKLQARSGGTHHLEKARTPMRTRTKP